MIAALITAVPLVFILIVIWRDSADMRRHRRAMREEHLRFMDRLSQLSRTRSPDDE